MFAEALEIRRGVTAVIGGGGKTSLLRTLGGELSPQGRVLLCTTTKIFPFDGIPTLHTREDLERAEGVLLCMGTPLEGGKLTAPAVSMAELAQMFDYVLVEADGSAGCPMKAHAPHEPVIPPEAVDVICVVGASGFGKPISMAAHRPERYAALMGAEQGNPITPHGAARVLSAEGLHGRVFVNQAETALDAAREFAKLLDCPVVLGSLNEGEIKSCSL